MARPITGSRIYSLAVATVLMALSLGIENGLLAAGDSLHLPFAIAAEKRLSDEELADKKEGYYVTGIPYLSSDPLNGFGAGAEAQIFSNGKKTDPFFAYTPFRAEYDVTFFYTTKAEKQLQLEVELPYLFNTKWRLHGELGYEVEPNLQYFGIGERSLAVLNNNGRTFSNYNDYVNSQTGNMANYNTYQTEEAIANFILHRSFLEGKIRFFLGMEMARSNYTTPLNANAFVHQDYLNGNIVGYGSNLITAFQPGLIYDTRNLETDPTRGCFAEAIEEWFPAIFGSPYSFNKFLVHYNWYQQLFPKQFKRVVFATRIGMNFVSGNAPFFEYTDVESSEKSIIGLGGPVTLRGYVQNRFMGKVIDFANAELRCRIGQTTILNQHLTFSGVPFFDAGGVWDSFSRLNHLENYRFSEGLGLRIGWNENTTLRFDYAFSPEDQQFFFQFGHTF